MNVKPISPLKVLMFFSLTLGVLVLLSLISPRHAVNITDSFQLRFFNFNEVVEEQPKYADLDTILSRAIAIDSITNNISKEKKKVIKKNANISVKSHKKFGANVAKLRSNIQFIEFPRQSKDLLNAFFQSLSKLKGSKNVVRILHYGDSQIEGDRISSYLRNRFQLMFGGSGPGMVPAFVPPSENRSVEVETQGTWIRNSVLHRHDSSDNNRFVGIYGTSSTLVSQDSLAQGALNYTVSELSYFSLRKFKRLRLFYGKIDTAINVSVYADDSLIESDKISGNKILNTLDINLNHSPKRVEYKIYGKTAPTVYGASFDKKSGIVLDNIAWRGSRGTEFHKINFNLLQSFFKELNVKLIIYQFGVNVVPLHAKSYKFYERQLVAELEYLKKVSNNVPILVVGVSDMSKKVDGWYKSFPNIVKIRNAQRNAAFETGCAFWDMYKAMGGENSMPSWVFAKPSLARKDFTHFNFRGAKLIAQMLYNSIYEQYRMYLNSNMVAVNKK